MTISLRVTSMLGNTTQCPVHSWGHLQFTLSKVVYFSFFQAEKPNNSVQLYYYNYLVIPYEWKEIVITNI